MKNAFDLGGPSVLAEEMKASQLKQKAAKAAMDGLSKRPDWRIHFIDSKKKGKK